MRASSSARLGADFAKLWTASAVSNIGDGITMVAGPLLVAARTDDPALVAGAAFAGQLPWLLFALLSGVYVDRVDRQRLIVAVNLLRGLAMAGLAVAIATGTATIPVIYLVFFLLGTGETLADTASAARLPGIVPPERLETANTRLMATATILNQFAAKPLGAWLFVVAAALPFGVNAATFVGAAALIAAMRPTPAAPEPRPRASLRTEVVEGIRWLWHHRLLRTLAFSMGVGNIVFAAAFATFVLYARQRLDLSEVAYGALLMTFAAGGLLGTLIAERLKAWLGAATLLRAGLAIEALTHLTLALSTSPWPVVVILLVFSTHGMVWGGISMATIQRNVPDRLLGRVRSVYFLLETGGAAALGSLLGGAIAQQLGIVAPFWIAAAAMAVVTVTAWRPLGEASRH